jgi:predicted GNAT family N-acyltransferase
MHAEFQLVQGSWRKYQRELSVVRRAVFVDEQHVPEELEWDEFDEGCHHVLVTDSANRPVGAGRVKPDGHIGRMAVLNGCRGQGIGSAILAAILVYAEQQHYPRVFLHAQITAIPFYEKHGFIVYGDRFMDAGIPHRSMRRMTGNHVSGTN